jgi:hypothetical protein
MPTITVIRRFVATICLSGALGGAMSAVTAAVEMADRPAGLEASVQAAWTGLPRREWAASVSRIAGIPVILDRRIDPTTPVSLECHGDRLGDVLKHVADTGDADVVLLASTIRIVPRSMAGRAVAAEEARVTELAALPVRARGTATARAAWTWPAAARPRDLVADLAAAAGLDIASIETIPHDHLPAASLPPLSLAERLDLVLAHYDQRVSWLAEGPAVVAITAPTAAPGVVRRPSAAAGPQSRRPGKTVTVRDVFSLRLEAPLDQALTAIAGRLALPLTIDTASLTARGIAVGEIVRVDVKGVTRDALLDAVVAPLDLAWSITDGQLRIYAPVPASDPEPATTP